MWSQNALQTITQKLREQRRCMQKFSNTKYDHTRLISNTKDAYGHIRFAQNTMDEHNNKGVHINIMKHAITQNSHKKRN